MNRRSTILLVLLIFSCKSKEKSAGFSASLQNKIKTYGIEAPCADAAVKEMEFKGRFVYVFEPGTCGRDMESKVLDEKGEELGTLGGFAGNTNIAGEDFSSARFVREVWRKQSEK